MKLTIEIDLDNDSFQENPKQALDTLMSSAYLKALEMFSDDVSDSRKLMDYNGNTVGTVKVEV